MGNTIKNVKIDTAKIDLLESRIMRLIREKAINDMTPLEIVIALNKVLANMNTIKELEEITQ
ncbi:MAG: hypothetical protein DRJ03_11130 [Chloroflexi bacterium]|nr:MAG: hypothetical protein DRJ03_11130 [Chloroflexota bacterium]